MVSPTLIKSLVHSRLIYDEFPLANQDILLKQTLYKIYYNIHNLLASDKITITIMNKKELPSLKGERILIVMYVLYIFCFHCASWHSLATLTEVLQCSFLSWKANAKV